MRIIKRGEVPNSTIKAKCKRCHTVFEFEKSEAKYTYDQREGTSIYQIQCPICGEWYFKYEK